MVFSWFFRGFFVAPFCLEKQCSGLFRYFFVVFSWLFRGPCFGQILRVLALEQSSEKIMTVTKWNKNASRSNSSLQQWRGQVQQWHRQRSTTTMTSTEVKYNNRIDPLHRKRSSRQLLGSPPPRVAAVKEPYLVQCGKCRGFFVKFLADTFPGNWRTRMCKFFRQIFTALFTRLLHKFHQNFALGENRPKQLFFT